MRAIGVALLFVVACRTTGSSDSAALRAEIDSLLATQRVEDALALADERIAHDPTRADAWRERTRCLVLQSEFDAALISVECAISLEPRDAWSHYERGYLLRQMGRDDDAISSFTRAIEIDARHFKAYEHRGGAHLDWGRNEAALADFTRAIEYWDPSDPGVAEAYSFRACAYTNLGRDVAAERDIERAEAIRTAPRRLGTSIVRLCQHELPAVPLGSQGGATAQAATATETTRPVLANRSVGMRRKTGRPESEHVHRR